MCSDGGILAADETETYRHAAYTEERKKNHSPAKRDPGGVQIHVGGNTPIPPPGRDTGPRSEDAV